MDRYTADRLAKLLGMTGSDQDGEALSAIRMANKVLADAKLTWAQIFASIPIEHTPRLADPPPRAARDMLGEHDDRAF